MIAAFSAKGSPVVAINKLNENQLYKKVGWRLIPILLIAYTFAYLDRVNIGFAKLQMLSDLHFSETVYGLGAGLFFIGYFLFEVPSNLILAKVGARVWMARIMVTWGIISACTMLVKTPLMFYTLRFLLGFAEAGFFPGIIYYLAVWYPEQRRGRIYALFMTGIAIAGVIGNPLSGWILQSSAGYSGLAGWQWLFLIEALPSIIIGLVLFVYLDDNITAARWLTPREKQLLLANLQPKIKPQTTTKFTLRQIFFNPQVWQLSLIYFCFSIGLYGVSFWLPSLIKDAGVNNELQIGLLTAIPYGCAIIAMLLVGHSSDLRHERRWHLAIPALIGGLSLYASTSFTNNLIFSMILLSIATAAILSIIPLFWSLPTTTFSGMMVASAIAWINSVGNLAGFVSPYVVGYLKDSTGSMRSGLNFVCWALTIGAWLVLWFKPRRNY